MNIINKLMEAYKTEEKVCKISKEDILELMSVQNALKFYADEDNFEYPIYDEHRQYNGSEVDKDIGAIARVALMEFK